MRYGEDRLKKIMEKEAEKEIKQEPATSKEKIAKRRCRFITTGT